MRIGIFETDHFEVTYTLIKLFDNGENTITLFVYQQSYHQLQYLLQEDVHKYNWIIKEGPASKFRFIRRMYRECRQQDIQLLYLNTVTDNFIFYAGMVSLLKNTRVILTLHDINNFFHCRPGWTFRRWARYIGKKWLVRIVEEFNVLVVTMAVYLKSILSAGKKVYCLPGAVFQEEQYLAPDMPVSQKIHLVVPGSVDERRRNYDQVFELLEASRQLAIPVVITLLGGNDGIHGQLIMERAREYALRFDNLFFYERTVVDQPEFDQVVHTAHFIFSPSVIRTIIADGIEETYGVSHISGNLSDMIKYARPGIIPDELAIPAALESSIVKYDKVADLLASLQWFIRDPSAYDKLKSLALDNSRAHSITNIRKLHPSVFLVVG